MIRIVVTGGTFDKEYNELNGTLFFSANDGINGIELWKSNGTAESTVRVTSHPAVAP